MALTKRPSGVGTVSVTLAFIVVALAAAVTSAADPAGSDRPRCQGETATMVGTSGQDRLDGSPGRDVIVARGAGDHIRTRGGADLICAGRGHDFISAGGGLDLVSGGPGPDSISLGPGADRGAGGTGRDALWGAPQRDDRKRDRCLGGGPDGVPTRQDDYADNRSCEVIRSAPGPGPSGFA